MDAGVSQLSPQTSTQAGVHVCDVSFYAVRAVSLCCVYGFLALELQYLLCTWHLEYCLFCTCVHYIALLLLTRAQSFALLAPKPSPARCPLSRPLVPAAVCP